MISAAMNGATQSQEPGALSFTNFPGALVGIASEGEPLKIELAPIWDGKKAGLSITPQQDHLLKK